MNCNYYKRKLLYAVGKYSDYNRYYLGLMGIEEEYDETLEIYNEAIWEGRSNGTIREKAVEMLRVTLELFEDLYRNAEQELYQVMKEIAALPAGEQAAIWEIVVPEKELSEERFEDMLEEWDLHEYIQEEALQEFLGYLKSYFEAYRTE